MMYISTITQKGQATIPAFIRKKLELREGDKIAFESIKDKIFLKKVMPFDYEYHKALEHSLSEWTSPEDEEAYRDL